MNESERPGLTFGPLRETVYRAEEILRLAGGLTDEEIGTVLADVVHGIAMPLIQIAQELNELKVMLNESEMRERLSGGSQPFIR